VAVRNEYVWEVRPPIPPHWQRTLLADEFQIDLKGTSIEIQADAGANDEAKKQRAAAIIENLMRAIGLREHAQYTARLASVAKLDDLKHQRSVTVLCEPAMLRISGGDVDCKVTNAEGKVVVDSREQRFKEALALASAAASSDTLRRMMDFRLAYYADCQHHLHHLLNIMELAEETGDRLAETAASPQDHPQQRNRHRAASGADARSAAPSYG
jgi:hypothetical protein